VTDVRQTPEEVLADRQTYGFDELRARQRNLAADRLEELAAIAQAMVTDLRGQPGESGQTAASDTAYARVYWLRREIGYVVNALGVGLPPRWAQRVVSKEYGAESGWSTPVDQGDDAKEES
jgi:hypothetical protein